MPKVDEEAIAEGERVARIAQEKEIAAVGAFLDAHVEFEDDEERAEVYKDLYRLTEIYKRLGRLEGYKQILSYVGTTPKTAETARHLALQEMDLLEAEGVKFINVGQAGEDE